MSAPVALIRPRPAYLPLGSAERRERSVRRRIGVAWALLVLNVMTYSGSILPIPSIGGQLITQGSLAAALLLLLSVNRRVVIRPTVFLCIVSLLPVEAIMSATQGPTVGMIYRIVRLAEFVFALWLLTPWWGRRDLMLVRYHLITLSVVVSSVLLGLLLFPGRAMGNGRLAGVLWAIPPTQVGHYAAVTMGLVVVLWLWGRARGRTALIVCLVAGTTLVLSHTRTALAGLILGVLIAALSMVVARARARKLFASAAAAAAVGILALSGFIGTYLSRGESTQELTKLTGRTTVWSALVSFPRDRFQEIFGFGLSNSSFNGLPIDSNWLASYQEQGFFGVTVCAAILVFLLVAACFQPRGVQRALALFLVTYCLVASFTEVGFTDASTYLLELGLAASLLVPPRVRHQPETAENA